MKNYYENVYILKGSLTEKEAKKECEEIKEYFKYTKKIPANYSGFMRLKKLAYEIKGEKQGYFYITYFYATPQETIEIERALRLNDNVIKFLTIKLSNEEMEELRIDTKEGV